MKRRLLSIGLTIFILLIMFTPVYAASSSNWDFTMDYRVVDGDANGKYHNLKKGDMSLSGSIYAYSKDAGAVEKPYKVYISIYESKTGVDRSVGKTSKTPSSQLNSPVKISGSWGEQNAGKYYLIVYKSEDDGWNIKGSGTIKTE